MPLENSSPKSVSDTTATSRLGDFRMTPQRREVFQVLTSRRDHPSASDVYDQVKETLPQISLATVYNCLEAMTQSGVVRQVNLDREPSRYCANLKDHAHLYCKTCGEVSDVPVHEFDRLSEALELPPGTAIDQLDVTVRGTCAHCSADGAPTPR